MSLLNSSHTTNSTQVSAFNGQQQHLNTVNHDATLSGQAVGTNGTTLASGINPADHTHSDLFGAVHHLGHLWG